jgi:hypothetical protein
MDSTKKFLRFASINFWDLGAAAVLISFRDVIGKFNTGRMIFMITIEILFYKLNIFIIHHGDSE